jgi:hypothetical protein
MTVVFISGPFRGPHAWAIQEHVMDAMRVALEVWRMGAVAICPHSNTMFFQGAAEDAVWLAGDLELLRRSDAVLTVEGWERSAGATAEVREARLCGVPVFHACEALRAWMVP